MKRDSPNRSQERVYVIHHTFERLYGFEIFFFFSTCFRNKNVHTPHIRNIKYEYTKGSAEKLYIYFLLCAFCKLSF